MKSGRIKQTLFQKPFYENFYSQLYDLFENYSCFEEVDRRFQFVVDRREDFMFERILDSSPDVVILGSAHVNNIEDCLFQYSSYRLFKRFILSVSVYRLGQKVGVIPPALFK